MENIIFKDKSLLDKVEKKALKVISMAMVGEKIINTSVNVLRIKNILEQEIEIEKRKKLENQEKIIIIVLQESQ